MADIDDDLMDLAGGSSGDEGSDNDSRRSRTRSITPKKKTKKAPAKKAKRRGRDDDSEEEGEAMSDPGTPNSLESAPMDESDSDAEPTRGRGEDDEKYPVEGMYMSQREKAEIMAMPELEREQIIAERVSEIERQRQNRLLRQMVENEERKQVKKKRSADTAELEDDSRKAARPRTGKGAETAMDSLRRARAEKQRRKEDQEKRRDNYSPRRSESRDRDESDDDFGRLAGSRSPEREAPRDAPVAELREYDRVRLGRNQFAEVCFTPGFEQAIAGCFMRIALGPHPETGLEQYRMASIKGFTTGRPYAIAGPAGTFVTDQYVKAAHGKAIREFPFIAASSGKFTDSELNRFTVTCSNEAVKLPTKTFLEDKVDDINNIIQHRWTDKEIKDRRARKTDLLKRFDPAEKERLATQLDEARQKGQDVKADELQEKIDQMGAQRLAFRTSLGTSKSDVIAMKNSEQDRLAERNRENRRLNAEAVRKAQLKEKAKAREMEEALKRREQAAKENGSTTTSANGTPKPAAAKTSIAAHLAKLQEEKYAQAKGVPSIHKPLMDDDVIGALDLDIDIDIDI